MFSKRSGSELDINRVMFAGVDQAVCGHRLKSSVVALLCAAMNIACSGNDSQPGSDPGSGSQPGAGGNGSSGGSVGSGAAAGANTGGTNPGGGAGGTAGTGGIYMNPNPMLGTIKPLYDETTVLEPAVVEDTSEALITRFADRARDRHARESQYQAYEHYLHIYWIHRTAQIEIIDKVAKGGTEITFNVKTEWKLDDKQAELRFFFRGIGTVAEYSDNKPMDPVIDDLHYTRTVTVNATHNRPLQMGDKLEFECSQFLDTPPEGRDNYYGTTYLYVVGKGLVPWAGTGELRDSEEIPVEHWLGGNTTVHFNESDEPDNAFIQLATNLAPQNAQRFVAGRRVAHTNFTDGTHDEHDENPVWTEQIGKQGPYSINASCNACHLNNGRAVPPEAGTPLDKFVFKVGGADGTPDPGVGGVLQPAGGEGSVSIASWTETDGLRSPTFAFDGAAPAAFSPRMAPQLVGMGLLEAIPELEIAKLADPDDMNGDGISGRMHVVVDPVTGDDRLGRFGWRAGQATVKYQTAGALKTDMGVLTSVFPAPDCGSAQTGCGESGAELGDTELDDLALYISLLGIRPQSGWADPDVAKGKEVFMSTGCANCHAPTFTTTASHPFAELRSQLIHPYTDLLLHDMGAGLADTLPEGQATYLEWRTAPLWGIGHTEGVSGEGYLHDGRARTLSEAILWHGGEGESAKNAFVALPETDKTALLAFLKSL
jgi:CxxC motif-containing protein (DUF1111 family)